MHTEYRTIEYSDENKRRAAPVYEPEPMRRPAEPMHRTQPCKRKAPAHAAPRRKRPHPGAPVRRTAPPPPKTAPAHYAVKNTKRRKRRRKIRGTTLLLCAVLSVLILGAFAKRAGTVPENGNNSIPVKPVCRPHEGPPYTIALDAGHGGSDCGAEGIIDEKTVTETTIGYLERLLEQDENYTPVRTHAYDTFAKPKERADTANEACASLVISVHGNSAPGYPDITGFECYPQPPGRPHHEDSARFAHLIAEKFGATGQRLRGESGVRYLYYEGDDIRGYEKKIIEESDSSVHTDQTFGLLERAECPAVLAEQCFVTSSTDIENWGNDTGCAHAARLYYEAICEFFGTDPIAK